MAKKAKTEYICSNCEAKFSTQMGRCHHCGKWGTIEAHVTEKENISTRSRKAVVKSKVKKVSEIQETEMFRIITGLKEFDRVVGGGLVRDSVTAIVSAPGGGKTTIATIVAGLLSEQGKKILYATGEESEAQVKNRIKRLIDNEPENLWILSDNSMDSVIDAVKEVDPDLIIVDSIQTFALEEFTQSRAGSPTQVIECASALVNIAKNPQRPRAVLMISQVNKENEMVGRRELEHLVDTVLSIEGENIEELRAVNVIKNRFGGAGETGFFRMTEKGMISVENPSEFFMTKREDNQIVPGSAMTVVKEGSRPIITEIESLVSKRVMAFPMRISDSFHKDKLNTLTSILEQRANNIPLFDKNIIVKVTGGLKIKEQAVNLAVLMSVVSSHKNIGIPSDVAFIADVGLTGELKKVPSVESRIRELARMGFKKVYIAKNSFLDGCNVKGIKVIELKTLKDVIDDVYK